MFRSLIAASFFVGCAAAAAQTGEHCESAHDCVVSTSCCPMDCCECPFVTSRAFARTMHEGCTHDDCASPDCAGRTCPPCAPVHAACVGHVCVAR
jgi:hypothetical protein